MSALRFARVVANSVHECAPDHSTHIIGVGELREAVAEMEALYEALERAVILHGDGGYSWVESAKAALAQARGDLVNPSEVQNG